MKSVYFILFYLLSGLNVFGQEILSQPNAKFITRFPFRQLSGGVLFVNATFDNIKDTLNFILDTGSGGISLDSSTCVEFNIISKPSDTTITGIGGVRKVPFVFNKTLHFPGLTINNLNFHINDYSLLSSVYGQKIDGIIGYSFFSKYIVKVNYDSSFIDVFSNGKFEYPKNGTMLNPAFTALPIQWANLKDKNNIGFNFYIDTGAGMYLLLNEKLVSDSNLLLKKRKPVYTQTEGMAGKAQVRLTLIKELKIGPYKFKRVPTYLYKDDFGLLNYPYIGGLIGNDLLKRFNIIFNYGARQIHLTPNKNFNDPFDYAYTGLSIYLIDNNIVVEDIIPHSPAAKAGFVVDDIIVGLNTNFSNNIQAYKDILQTPNVTISVLVRRKGVLKLLTLNTESVR